MSADLWGAPCPPRWYAAHIVRGERDPARDESHIERVPAHLRDIVRTHVQRARAVAPARLSVESA